ncbi:MAG: hypothetical protein V3U03_17370 [Myxococcota bacterium]
MIRIGGVPIQLLDERLLDRRGPAYATRARNAKLSTHLSVAGYSDFELGFLRFIDAWRDRYNVGKPVDAIQMLLLADSWIEAKGRPPSPPAKRPEAKLQPKPSNRRSGEGRRRSRSK